MLLFTLIARGIFGLVENAKVDRAKALIERLKGSLHSYYELFRDYPPSDGKWADSQNLYYYLGEKLERVVEYNPKTGVKRTEELRPIDTFKPGELDSEKYILDAWKNRIHYKKPGEHNTKTYDLASWGKDGKKNEPGSSDFDDITNWMTEK